MSEEEKLTSAEEAVKARAEKEVDKAVNELLGLVDPASDDLSENALK